MGSRASVATSRRVDSINIKPAGKRPSRTDAVKPSSLFVSHEAFIQAFRCEDGLATSVLRGEFFTADQCADDFERSFPCVYTLLGVLY